ncbi:MAG: FHA domain-containing protein [Methylomonas sp.]|nr:FHA domain-containing protein [Methylomonas sp.]PPD20405.1 MAG: forkhead-associated protein [Methylomonas sp.]PPD25674.1 MAG: forkhead-associated protein [Methylomonas sp.]PPD36651.1 MAG: forkhead-associated protein [Methylomonas sp.]PPD40556.1 MAG: forkhead-associated protein [Methylomonas sp.]
MAKFTVYFKDKPIQTASSDAGRIHIGRDDTNDLIVDSLAVAPAHAVIVIKDGNHIIRQLNEKYPLLINHQPVKEWTLQNNDRINVGKHYIVFSSEEILASETVLTDTVGNGVKALNKQSEDRNHLPDANLQIMDGPHIGRILPLKKAMTRLGRDGGGVVVIARRKDGYYVSALQGNDGLSINDQPLADLTVKLSNNDVLHVDQIPMQFFFG